MPKKLPLLDWDTTAQEVLEEFPMLKGATKGELKLTQAITQEAVEDGTAVEEDQLLLRAIDILFLRMEDQDYIPAEDTDDTPGGGGALVPV